MVQFSRRKIASKIIRIRREENKKKIWKRIFEWGVFLSGFLALLFFFRNLLFLLILQVLAFVLTPVLPDITNFEALFASQSTIIYDREGRELYTIHGEENRFEVPLAKIPENLILATLAAEDDNFFHHYGFDPDGLLKAFLSELKIGRPRGGSTITQQFVKNAYLSPERTYWRKLQELLLALKLENKFTKEEILEMYLNRIPYGGNVYGVQAAAQVFLAKNAEDLTMAESVVLAGIPQAPTRYSPYGASPERLMGFCHLEEEEAVQESGDLMLKATGQVGLQVTTDTKIQKEWTAQQGEMQIFPFTESFEVQSENDNFELFLGTERILTNGKRIFQFQRKATVLTKPCLEPFDPRYTEGRKDYVLGRMLELNFISPEDFLTVFQEAHEIEFQQYQEKIKAPHFVFFIREKLEELYGKDLVERGGLRVTTTLDPALQQDAERIIAESFPRRENSDQSLTWLPNSYGATNAALLALDNQTGQILAMVGSRDYFEKLDENGFGNDGATNLTIRLRQPGSSFKPFVYATGFAKRSFTPASVFWDVETNLGRGEDYIPQNYDGKFFGPMSLRTALAYSRNVPAVKTAALLGELTIVDFVKNLGFKNVAEDKRYGSSIGLGVAEVTMLELVQGYSVFANGGKRLKPTGILKITDSHGNLIDKWEVPEELQGIEPEVAFLITDILADSAARPEGWNNRLNLQARPNAAKTGTANKRISAEMILPRDTWTIGYTPQITTAVWVGNNDGSVLKESANGLMTASGLWRKFMLKAHRDLPVLNFPVPKNIVQRSVSKLSGLLVSETTPVEQIKVETFASSNVPLKVDNIYREITIDTVSKKLPTNLTPQSALLKKVFVELHSELPQTSAWEEPVQEWLSKNLAQDLKEKDLHALPTEFDDVHTQQTARQKPTIKIVAPVSNSTIDRKSVGVWVDVTAPHGVQRVEFYQDNELVFTATKRPYKGLIPIPLHAQDGQRFQLEARVIDRLYYAASSKIEVQVGKDTQAPTVNFVTPTAQQKIPRQSAFVITIKAFDAGSDVKKVELFLDKQKIGEFTEPPFELPFFFGESFALGEHTLRVEVTDQQDYQNSAQVSFQLVAAERKVLEFKLLAPPNGAQIKKGTIVAVLAQIPREKFIPIQVNFFVREFKTGKRWIFAELNNPTEENLKVSWRDFEVGEYEIYAQAIDASGEKLILGGSRVQVQP